MLNIIASVLVILTLTAIPTISIVGFFTDEQYRNPFVLFLIIMFIYIGVKAWMKPS
jgi:hypothetical protein